MQNEQEKIIGGFFDDCANKGYMASFSDEEKQKLTAFISDWDINEGEKIFEPGCGSGRLTEIIAQLVGVSGAVHACDLSAKMIALAKNRSLTENVKVYQGSVTDVPVGEGFFDKILLFQVFPHFDNRQRALGEIRRILKTGGDLWINHLMSREKINDIHRNASAVVISHRLPDEIEMRELLESSEFAVEGIWDSAEGYKAHAVKL